MQQMDVEPDDKIINEITIEEYKALWTYYIKTLDERGRIFDIYFKFVTIPAAVAGFIVYFSRSLADGIAHNQNLNELIFILNAAYLASSAFFLLSSISGLFCYIYYQMESANAKNYILASNAIRSFWRKKFDLDDILIIDKLRPSDGHSIFSIPNVRGFVFVIFNSSMFLMGSVLYMSASYPEFKITSKFFLLTICSVVAIHGIAAALSKATYRARNN